MAKGKGKQDNGTPPLPGPLAIRRVRLDDLHADPANVNTHGEANLRQIRDSLREFGQVEPLVVHKATGKVIGGNGRLEVMRAEGWAEADVVEFDGTPTRAMALAITLNRTAKTSQFNDEALAATLRALQEEGFPVAAAGFDDAELDSLLAGLETGPGAGTGPGAYPDDAMPPEDFPDHGEGIATDYRCPKCQYEWSGKPK
jgi:ParB-like chromosome segregation protein Spo0J